MPDDLNNPSPPDTSRINLDQRYEVLYWTKHLDITEAELREAVRAVGISSDAVINWLQRKNGQGIAASMKKRRGKQK
jgi:CRISPR/Cas system-associated endonuclease Cas3-HD